jgi:hypothetical protein
MPTNQQKEMKESRERRTRILGAYIALKAWRKGFDCIVLSRTDQLNHFYMGNTPGNRTEQIAADIKLWFREHQIYHRAKSNTYVHYSFLLRKKDDKSHLRQVPHLSLDKEPNERVVKKYIEELNSKALKTALFSDLVGKVPSDEDIISELALLSAGLEPSIKKEVVTKPIQSKSPPQKAEPREIKSGVANSDWNW